MTIAIVALDRRGPGVILSAMAARTDPRRSAVTTAVRLFRRQGFHGTGLAQILEESGSPRGSFYFHFPGGKEQLGAEAVAYAGAAIEALWEQAAREAGDAGDFLERIARQAARWLERSGWREGCPVAVVALEATPASERLREAADGALARWTRLVARRLRRDGVPAARARSLAVLFAKVKTNPYREGEFEAAWVQPVVPERSRR